MKGQKNGEGNLEAVRGKKGETRRFKVSERWGWGVVWERKETLKQEITGEDMASNVGQKSQS